KLDRMGMVVLRSTTLCVAVSSRSRSWRLMLISSAEPCAPAACDDFSCSRSRPGMNDPRCSLWPTVSPVCENAHQGNGALRHASILVTKGWIVGRGKVVRWQENRTSRPGNRASRLRCADVWEPLLVVVELTTG